MLRKSKKSSSKRSNAQYPALRKDLNLKGRRYYIEPDYINGVPGIDADSAIRPLTEKEKAWLNKFYEESIIASFTKTRADLHKGGDKRKEIYRENNARNRDLYSVKQKTGQLQSFSSDNYDKMCHESIGHLDFEELLVQNVDTRDICRDIRECVCGWEYEYEEVAAYICSEYPEYYRSKFTDKELEKLTDYEIGETLFLEAKITLEN
jgi:hypothetical protein